MTRRQVAVAVGLVILAGSAPTWWPAATEEEGPEPIRVTAVVTETEGDEHPHEQRRGWVVATPEVDLTPVPSVSPLPTEDPERSARESAAREARREH